MSKSISVEQVQIAKRAAAKEALKLVEPGMLLGLGTGSTTAIFIDELIQAVKSGLKIRAVATSKRSEMQARQGGIFIEDINQLKSLNLTIDGADEVDSKKRLIKGGGGALLREKIVASMSDQMVVIVDENKIVEQLGKFPLPVEIIPFAYTATIEQINRLGFRGQLRIQNDYKYVTDNGNYIYDLHLNPKSQNLENVHSQLIHIPGVIETGLFIELAKIIIIGRYDETVEIRS